MPGFISLVLGFVIYNEMLLIPYFDFDRWTKDKMKSEPSENI